MTRAELVAGARHKALSPRSVRRSRRRGRVQVAVPRRLRQRSLRLVVAFPSRSKHTTTSVPPTTTTTTTTTTPTTTTTTPTSTNQTPPATTTAPAPTPTTGTVGDPSVVNVPAAGPALSDAAAAALVTHSTWEPRPDNATANSRVPTSAELATYRANAENWGSCNNYHQYVTGNFTGTTDEIIQWAAYKWGLDPNLARAVAVYESNWHMSAVGDSGVSFGLFQIKKTFHTGTYPLSTESTAYNADFWAAMVRYYYDGCATWLNDGTGGVTYAKGDLWGSIGAWYAGAWHTTGAESYISAVKAR